MRREEWALRQAQRETEWQDRLLRQATSGQSIAAFCRSEGVTQGMFYSWRSRLHIINPIDAKTTQATPTPFIDIGAVKPSLAHQPTPALNDANDDRSQTIEVRIDLGQGVVLQIFRH